MGILSAIGSALKALAIALGLIDKATERKAGVDAQRSLELQETVKAQQAVTQAPAAMETPERASREVDPKGWLKGPPKVVVALLLFGCAHNPGVYDVKPAFVPPPPRPQFTSDVTEAEARWIVSIVKWGENYCAVVAVMNGLPTSRCLVR